MVLFIILIYTIFQFFAYGVFFLSDLHFISLYFVVLIPGADWINLAQVRDQWQAVANTVMNL
jgi:hypothetical protein